MRSKLKNVAVNLISMKGLFSFKLSKMCEFSHVILCLSCYHWLASAVRILYFLPAFVFWKAPEQRLDQESLQQLCAPWTLGHGGMSGSKLDIPPPGDPTLPIHSIRGLKGTMFVLRPGIKRAPNAESGPKGASG